MADDDEIDVLGDFSFNSCFAQNNQGIPSCSNREDTVHPQWLLDATETNWYDKKSHRKKEGSPRKLYGNSSVAKHGSNEHTAWSPAERQLLVKEMAKYGRNIRKISQTLKTKTEAEIQALLDAEYGVHLETPLFRLEKHEEIGDIPPVVQEEIVTDDATTMNNVLNIVATGSPTINVPKTPFRKKNINSKSLLKPDILKSELIAINPSEILYEDDLIIGSTESIGSDLDLTDLVSKNIVKYQAKAEKKIGSHRRKVSRNYDKGSRNKSKELRSPQQRQRKDSSLSEDSVKSPKMQIVLGSGQALPLSEGEQVIKIDKKKDSDPESDIEVDIDSDNEGSPVKRKEHTQAPTEEPIAVPLRKFEPMPKRQKKINLDGGGGYTIMHTEAGDLYEKGSEPRKERPPRKQPVPLLQCRLYNAEKPAPYEVRLNVSTLILMDAHGHTSRGEVMGLVGGAVGRAGGAGAGGAGAAGAGGAGAGGAGAAGAGGAGAGGAGAAPPTVRLAAYRPAAAAAGSTHCDMDPVSQSVAAERLRAMGAAVCGWHHSHPRFPPAPSGRDLATQRGLQRALERPLAPFLGLITSQHWPTGRSASQYRCIRVEDGEDPDTPIGYQFSVKLSGDLTPDNLPAFLQELKTVLKDDAPFNELSVDMAKDICPQAGMTYLDKCISSVSHHMRSADYSDDDSVVKQLLQGIGDIFR